MRPLMYRPCTFSLWAKPLSMRPLDDASLTDVSRPWTAYKRWIIAITNRRYLGALCALRANRDNPSFALLTWRMGRFKYNAGPLRVDVPPTDVSPTENSWMLRPLNKASLVHCAPDRCVPTLDCIRHGTSSVGLRHLMDQWGVWPASPTPLTRFIGLSPLRRMHARPTHRTPHIGMGWFGQGQNSQGTLCPRDATSKNFQSGTHRSGTD